MLQEMFQNVSKQAPEPQPSGSGTCFCSPPIFTLSM